MARHSTVTSKSSVVKAGRAHGPTGAAALRFLSGTAAAVRSVRRQRVDRLSLPHPAAYRPGGRRGQGCAAPGQDHAGAAGRRKPGAGSLCLVSGLPPTPAFDGVSLAPQWRDQSGDLRPRCGLAFLLPTLRAIALANESLILIWGTTKDHIISVDNVISDIQALRNKKIVHRRNV